MSAQDDLAVSTNSLCLNFTILLLNLDILTVHYDKFCNFLRWLAALDNTKWLHHIGGLMRTAVIVVNAVSEENRPVLVHCSDGWDRTPQIVALAKLLLDPYYRTIEVLLPLFAYA